MEVGYVAQARYAVSGSWEKCRCVMQQGTRASPRDDTACIRFGMDGRTGRLKSGFCFLALPKLRFQTAFERRKPRAWLRHTPYLYKC